MNRRTLSVPLLTFGALTVLAGFLPAGLQSPTTWYRVDATRR